MQRYVAALPVERAAVEHVGIGGDHHDHAPRSSRHDRHRATEQGTHRAQREHVAALHAHLTRYELVTWTSGNVSERVPGEDLFVIKGSGVEYDELTWEGITVCDLDGSVVDGVRAPSSDTAAHAYVYRNMPEVNGQVHTHSTYAAGLGGARRGDPLRAHRDGRRVRRPDPGGARSR